MKFTFLFAIMLMSACSICSAQNNLAPGTDIFEKKWLKSGTTEMTYYAVKEHQKIEIGSFVIQLNATNKSFSVVTKLTFINSPDQWIDTSISDVVTFKPLYRSSFNKDNNYILQYNKEITGYFMNKKTQRRNSIRETVQESFFDGYAYPYLLGLLPLATGYKKDLIVYDYKPENKTNISKTRIEEVKNNIYESSLTGEHKVWQVSVFEETTGDKYDYYIDKENRRIWKIEIVAKAQHLLLIDKETDYNPFTNKFNKDETLKLIKNGNSIISGEVFARDNENEGALKGMAILNVHKKQFAKKGTAVILIPYTPFFKEWLKLNEASRKKGRAIPLPTAATECMKVAPVYDNEGHFEFVNLMPGDYLLYTEFGYVHSGVQTEVTGYTDTYINGIFQGSSANTESYGYSTNASAAIKKIVTIKKESEKVSVKLKKTL